LDRKRINDSLPTDRRKLKRSDIGVSLKRYESVRFYHRTKGVPLLFQFLLCMLYISNRLTVSGFDKYKNH